MLKSLLVSSKTVLRDTPGAIGPYVVEATQLANGRVISGNADVQTARSRPPRRDRHSRRRTLTKATVSHRDGWPPWTTSKPGSGNSLEGLGGQSHGEVGEVELGVRQTKAKLVLRLDVALVERAVVDIETSVKLSSGKVLKDTDEFKRCP